MRSQKRGGPPALPSDEIAVTYSRIEDAAEPLALGDEPLADGFAQPERREPVFTAVRVDPPRRRERAGRVDVGAFDDGAIPLDPEALGAAMPPPRGPRRRRSPVLRVVLVVGAIAVLGGIGVVGATVMKVIYGGQAPVAIQSSPDTASPGAEATASTVDPTAVPVATPNSVLPDSGSAGPGVLAIPANDGGPPIDMTPGKPAAQRSEAALSPVPPPAPEPAPAVAAPVVAAPEARPVARAQESPPARSTATAEPPPLPAPAPAPNFAAAPTTGTDAQIDSALSDVDRLLAAKKATAAAAPTGDAAVAQPQATLPLPADQSAALAITPPDATILPPLPAPATTGDPAMPVPPADIPDTSN